MFEPCTQQELREDLLSSATDLMGDVLLLDCLLERLCAGRTAVQTGLLYPGEQPGDGLSRRAAHRRTDGQSCRINPSTWPSTLGVHTAVTWMHSPYSTCSTLASR